MLTEGHAAGYPAAPPPGTGTAPGPQRVPGATAGFGPSGGSGRRPGALPAIAMTHFPERGSTSVT